MRVAILGAGDLGATLARRLAESERFREVFLVDANESRARGKALDLAQSGPVEGYDTRITGQADPPEGCAMIVAADPAELEGRSSADAAAWTRAVVPRLGPGVFLAAGGHGPTIVEAAVKAGVPRDRVLGSAPLAWAAALRRQLSSELAIAPSGVELALLGLPPEHCVVPGRSLYASGLSADALPPTALRKALETVRRRVPGPVALAAAATRVLIALQGPPGPVLPVWAWLDGEHAQRGIALAVMARLGGGRLQSVRELPLEPVERVAFENAAQKREEGR
jgi:malate dehydrogenase